jgi:hypothetical protein
MADNNLEIRARLSGEDRLSSTVVKLLAKIKSLEAQMAKLGKAGNAITEIPMEKYVKQVTAGQKALNGLTKKHLDWAKANGVAGDKAQLAWTQLTNEIIRSSKEHDKYANSTARGAKKRMKIAEDELKQHYKNAVAFKYLYNQTGDQRLDMQRRVTEQLGNLEAAHLRNQERNHRTHLGNLTRMRRDAMRSMHQMSNIGSRAIPYAAVGAAATGAGSVSAFRARMRADTAEMNMSVFGEMSREDVAKQRKEWMNAAAIKYGMTPDKMVTANTETIKAGIDKEKAGAVTRNIVEAVSGLGLDIVETTRMATRLATATGDLSKLDPDRLRKMINGVVVASAATAADPNEVIAANKRSMGVFATTKGFTPEHLSAINAAGIGAGLQAFKEGTLVDYFVNELGGAGNAKGQRAGELNKVAQLTGFGNRKNMALAMRNDTTNSLLKVIESIDALPEEKANLVLTLLGKREWRGEIGQWAHAAANIRKAIKDVDDPKNANKTAEISDAKRKSLEGRWASLTAAWFLIWESVGAGFEKAFGQISEFFTDYLGRIDTSKISATVEAFTDGLVAGLGFDSWSDMLKAAFGDPATVKGYATEVFGFVKGFTTGMREMWSVISGIWNGLMKASGIDSSNPESVGLFTARIVELVTALKAIGSVASALEGILIFLKGLTAIAAAFAGVPGIAALVSLIGAKYQDAGVPDYNIRKKGESYDSWQQRREEGKKRARDPNYKPTSFGGATDFSGRRRDDLAENLNKFTGKVERASFIGGGGVIRTGGGGGSGLGGMTSRVPGLITSTPGSAIPNLLGNGGIIKRDNIPSFGGAFSDSTMAAKDKAWYGRGGSANGFGTDPKVIAGATPGGGPDGVGAGLSGNSFLQARRAKFAEELKNDPNLRMHLAAMQQTEGASKGGTIESLMNRADMQGKTMRQMLGYSADGQINPKSFYGPIRRGELGPAIRRLQNNPAEFAKYDAWTNKALAGGHAIGGYTDQGLATDPNGSARTGIAGFKISPRDGNEFTDWVGPGSAWGKGRAGAMNYRKFIEQGIAGGVEGPVGGSVPTPAQAVQGVPPAIRGDASLGLQGGGGGGPVAIHINGSSHDPEALATLVQRRIDESMNWRTHDTSSEYS